MNFDLLMKVSTDNIEKSFVEREGGRTCLCINLDQIWFWVDYKIEFGNVKDSNGVGGDESFIEVLNFEILTIEDNQEELVELDQAQLSEFKSKLESCLLELKYEDS